MANQDLILSRYIGVFASYYLLGYYIYEDNWVEFMTTSFAAGHFTLALWMDELNSLFDLGLSRKM